MAPILPKTAQPGPRHDIIAAHGSRVATHDQPAEMNQSIDFSHELDVGLCRRTFQHCGRIHIPGVLEAASADWLHNVLQNEVPWQVHFNEGGRNYDLHRDQVAVLPESKRIMLTEQLTRNATARFQYLFHNYPISDAVLQNAGALAIHDFHTFVNAPHTIKFIQEITGALDISYADCQATRYQAGQFLTTHNDDLEGKDRRVAYVFNFTRNWRPDFGGLLLFLDEQGHVEEGYLPLFNSLNLFRIPAHHCVSYVTPFANGCRYSISGWFRAGPPAG